MDQKTYGELIARWKDDSVFRENMRADPQGTLKKHGVTLDSHDLAALDHIDWGLSDHELTQLAEQSRDTQGHLKMWN
jgi:hypothetical protein